VLDDDAGALRQRMRRRCDGHGAFRPAPGRLDRGEPEQRESGPARAADDLVRVDGHHERGPRRGRPAISIAPLELLEISIARLHMAR